MLQNLTKVHGIKRSFSQSKTFGFNKILSHFVSLMDKISRFTRILQILRKRIKAGWQKGLKLLIYKKRMQEMFFDHLAVRFLGRKSQS
jgi:hypothetical protein